MSRTMTVTALAVTAVLAAAGPVAAKPTAYSGKAKGGSKITFKLSKGKMRSIKGVIPASCFTTSGVAKTSGGELFAPPGAVRIGREVKSKAKQHPALALYPVTKTYTVDARRTGRRISGKLGVSFSYVDFGGYYGYTLVNCFGSTTFSASPR